MQKFPCILNLIFPLIEENAVKLLREVVSDQNASQRCSCCECITSSVTPSLCAGASNPSGTDCFNTLLKYQSFSWKLTSFKNVLLTTMFTVLTLNFYSTELCFNGKYLHKMSRHLQANCIIRLLERKIFQYHTQDKKERAEGPNLRLAP